MGQCFCTELPLSPHHTRRPPALPVPLTPPGLGAAAAGCALNVCLCAGTGGLSSTRISYGGGLELGIQLGNALSAPASLQPSPTSGWGVCTHSSSPKRQERCEGAWPWGSFWGALGPPWLRARSRSSCFLTEAATAGAETRLLQSQRMCAVVIWLGSAAVCCLRLDK